jgi:hypothetical protein
MSKKSKKNKRRKKTLKILDFIFFKVTTPIIAVVAIVLSYLSYHENFKEDLLISVNRISDDYVTDISISPDFSFFPSILTVKYKCKLTNNSNKPISIIDYKAISGGSTCVGMNYNIRKTSVVDLPLKIEQYETASLYIDLAYHIDSNKVLILQENIQDLKEVVDGKVNYVEMKDVISALYSQGIDIFGNKVIQHGSGFKIGNGELKQEIFRLYFQTSTDNHFTKDVGYYRVVDDLPIGNYYDFSSSN